MGEPLETWYPPNDSYLPCRDGNLGVWGSWFWVWPLSLLTFGPQLSGGNLGRVEANCNVRDKLWEQGQRSELGDTVFIWNLPPLPKFFCMCGSTAVHLHCQGLHPRLWIGLGSALNRVEAQASGLARKGSSPHLLIFAIVIINILVIEIKFVFGVHWSLWSLLCMPWGFELDREAPESDPREGAGLLVAICADCQGHRERQVPAATGPTGVG